MALKLSSLFRGNYYGVAKSSLNKSVLPTLSTMMNKSYPQFQTFHRLSTTHFTTSQTYNNLLIEKRDNNIGIITLNRPKALNALCIELLDEIVRALQEFEKDDTISAIIITGSGGIYFFIIKIDDKNYRNFLIIHYRKGILCGSRYKRDDAKIIYGCLSGGYVYCGRYNIFKNT